MPLPPKPWRTVGGGTMFHLLWTLSELALLKICIVKRFHLFLGHVRLLLHNLDLLLVAMSYPCNLA